MSEKKKRITKKQKETFNFIFLIWLAILALYLFIDTNSLIWMFLLIIYSVWIILSGVRLRTLIKYKDLQPMDRFQAEIINGRKTVYPDVLRMKSFVLMSDAVHWAKENADSDESWRVIDLYTGKEIHWLKGS